MTVPPESAAPVMLRLPTVTAAPLSISASFGVLTMAASVAPGAAGCTTVPTSQLAPVVQKTFVAPIKLNVDVVPDMSCSPRCYGENYTSGRLRNNTLGD